MATKRFAVFDIDGTLIRWQLYHAIVDTLGQHGHMSPNVYKALRKARLAWKRRAAPDSFSAYELQLVSAYNTILSQLTTAQFDKAVDEVFTEYKDQVYTYTRNLLKELRKKQYVLLAISGSQSEIVSKIADYYGFDDYVGVEQERAGRRFTGIKSRVFAKKHRLLQHMIEKHGLIYTDSIGVGDSEGDISMLELVEQPIAFNPTRELFAHATKQGWKIVVERKNMVYELEPRSGTYLLAQTKR